jgi:hypothetical protein
MNLRLWPLTMAALVAACASMEEEQAPVASPAINAAQNRYLSCVEAAIDKRATSPAAADDIVAAAEGDCRTEYLSYADLVRAEAAALAHSRAERQLENDRTDAQLRAMQLDVRRQMRERVATQSLTRKQQ